MRPLLALIAIVIGLSTPLLAAEESHRSRPNVLIFLADDMGYSDAGCYGGEIATPNLDSLAKDGLRFTQFYNTARCWPSRAALMTGYYAQAVRRDSVPGVKSGAQGTRPEWAQLLPAMLKPLGYRTYHSGKWHIDGLRLPAGFDRSYSLEDHDHNFSPKAHFEDDVKLPAVQPGTGYYTTTAIAEHALSYLKEHAEKHAAEPFFAYVAFTCPHFPLQAPAEDIARYQHTYQIGFEGVRAQRFKRQKELGIYSGELSAVEPEVGPPYAFPDAIKKLGPDEINRPIPWADLTESQRSFQATKMSIHAAMVDRMDQEIGRVLAQVKAMGKTDDTLVLFLSDNGASAEMMVRGDGHDQNAAPGGPGTFLSIGPGWSTVSNTPFRRHKTWVHEGGIATPLIVRWPKGIATKGELRNTPGHLIDVVPTILEIVGGQTPRELKGKPVPPPPGKSLLPAFAKDGTVTHDFLWWQHEGNRALRAGDWKIVAAGKESAWELYDLSKDRAEANNLAEKMPEKVKELSAIWEKQRAENDALAKREPPPAGPGRKPASGQPQVD